MKSLLTALVLMVSFTAQAETDFFGNKVLRCEPGTVATLSQKENQNNRLSVLETSAFYCADADAEYILDISALVVGLKLNGPDATGEVTFRCPATMNVDGDFSGSYNYVGLAIGLGYSGFIGQAAKLGSGGRDCVFTIGGYEIVEVSARVGRINIQRIR